MKMRGCFKFLFLVIFLAIILIMGSFLNKSVSRGPAALGVDPYIKLVPYKDFREGLKEYFSNLNNIHGGANESIEQSYLEFAKTSPCFNEIAYKFYSEILNDDLTALRKSFQERKTSIHKVVGRPNLSMNTGIGNTSHLKPGWL